MLICNQINIRVVLSMNLYLKFFILLCIPSVIFSQRNVSDSCISTPWIGVHYGGNWTSGDLADRYGFLNHIGGIAGYKTNKNWFWGVEGNFIFGNKVNIPNLFDALKDSKGNITDMNGDIARVLLYARGFNANVSVGKIIPVLSPNKNSGIFVYAGVGYLLHKMRIETNDQVVPSIELSYKKGYDRLTIGPNTNQFVGYAFMANRGFINFYAGFYAQQGFTKNQRDVFFDQPDVPVSKAWRTDIQIGFKVGWFIPVYKRQPKEYYYN